jgi:hypothetical protein
LHTSAVSTQNTRAFIQLRSPVNANPPAHVIIAAGVPQVWVISLWPIPMRMKHCCVPSTFSLRYDAMCDQSSELLVHVTNPGFIANAAAHVTWSSVSGMSTIENRLP